MTKIRMSDRTRVDIQNALDKGFGTVVFAVGSNEQHGPHLPTSTNSLIGDVLANKVAVKLGKALQAPSIKRALCVQLLSRCGQKQVFPSSIDSSTIPSRDTNNITFSSCPHLGRLQFSVKKLNSSF